MSSFKTHHPSLWYLAYTKPRQEEIARVNLEQQGFESYLPLYKKFKKTETGLVSVFEPMFPRYIFFVLGVSSKAFPPCAIPGVSATWCVLVLSPR